MSRIAAPLISVLTLVLSLVSAAPLAGADASDPTAQSALLPSPAESGMPEKITRKEVRRIRREFTELLDQERDRLRADETRRRREGDVARKVRRREWDTRERTTRRKYFEENSQGAVRRQYVKEFNDRRKAFYDELRNEERIERAELDGRWKALKDSQRARLNSVEEALRRSERPSSRLLERAD